MVALILFYAVNEQIMFQSMPLNHSTNPLDLGLHVSRSPVAKKTSKDISEKFLIGL